MQAKVDAWITRLTEKGYKVASPIIVFTVGTQADSAAGWRRGYAASHLGVAGRTSPDDLAMVYVKPRGPHVMNTLIHEVLHHVTPHLPHWKVRALAAELIEGRTGERIRAARTKTDLLRNQRIASARVQLRYHQQQITKIRAYIREQQRT
jgi:hypothetical protein